MVVRTVVIAGVSGFALLVTGACGTSPTPAAVTASPAALPAAWYNTKPSAPPSIAPAQVAPGAYRPVPATTGLTPTVPATLPTGTATANCSPALGPATTVGVTATTGAGTITTRWTELSDPAVLSYRIAAIPSYGAPAGWLTVAATHTCKTLSVTVTGLARHASYEIWVDAVHTVTSYGMGSARQETMIGRSTAVTVP